MTEYVITPNNGDRVIFAAWDADSDHEAGMAVLRAVGGDHRLASQMFFYKALETASDYVTDVEISDRLVGQGWFELAPVDPLSGGTPGGDYQDGDALARRFAMKRPDGTWAVVTRYVYLSIPHGEPSDSESRVVEVMNEFAICKDLHDIDGTSFWSYETYTGLPHEPTHRTVRREASLMFSGDILWNGEEFRSRQLRTLVRP
jgi:hypothetical protein